MEKMDPLEQFGQSELLWKDRKRILGLPISFTAYRVDRDRLICKKGFFKTEVDELLLYRILDIKSTRTLGQKLLHVLEQAGGIRAHHQGPGRPGDLRRGHACGGSGCRRGAGARWPWGPAALCGCRRGRHT